MKSEAREFDSSSQEMRTTPPLPTIHFDETNRTVTINERTFSFKKGISTWETLIFLARSKTGRTTQELNEFYKGASAVGNVISNLRMRLDTSSKPTLFIAERGRGFRINGIIEFEGEEERYVQEFTEGSGNSSRTFYSVSSHPKPEKTAFTQESKQTKDKKTPRDLYCDATKRVLFSILKDENFFRNPFELMKSDIPDLQVRMHLLGEIETYEKAKQKIVDMVLETTASIWEEPTTDGLSQSENEAREVAQKLQKAGFDLPRVQDVIQSHFKTGSDEEEITP